MDIKRLLELSAEKDASDLHLLPGCAPLIRVNGILTPIKNMEPFTADEVKHLIYNEMTEIQQRAFEKNLVCEIALSIPELGNFRVSVLHQLHGISAVFRIIPSKIPDFEELSFPASIKPLLGLSHGLILVTGQTGSGKSTSLAAMIDYINIYRSCHIITIEDPIEYIYENKKSVFNQIQVGRDTPNFATALRAALRQDPNVILIGELRDLETARLALTAAETGHLIFATLHAGSAPFAINRFVDVFPVEERSMVRVLLAETLQAVLCQTLVRKVSGGRIAAFEVMLATTAIRHHIRQDMPSHMELVMQTSGNRGMCTMEQALHKLVSDNIIHLGVANSIIAAREAFKEMKEGPENKNIKV